MTSSVDSRQRPIALATRWLTAPEPRAAGRMGIFRVLFGAFYLWHLSVFDVSTISGMPAGYRVIPIGLFDRLLGEPALLQLRALDAVLVAALVLLALGLGTRTVTVVVLAAGVLREALLAGVAVEDGNLFLVFYIPLFMAVAGRWGDTHSLDAMRRRRRGAPTVDPEASDWTHFLAARATLVILAVLFLSAALLKSTAGGSWLTDRDLLVNLMLEQSVESVRLGLGANPVAPWLVGHPLLAYGLQLGVLVFEGLFFLALVGGRCRTFFLTSALVFHSVNALFLTVSFTPILIVYGLFVDWEGLFSRVWRPRTADRLPRVSSSTWVVAALVLAALTGLAWRAGVHSIFDLGGRLTWHSVWVPIFPLAVAGSAWAAVRLLADIARSVRPGRTVGLEQ